jgi:plasmid maintenance system antidote protein VapI
MINLVIFIFSFVFVILRAMMPGGIKAVAAENSRVTRQSLSRLINVKSGISADMVIRLSNAFDTSSEYRMHFEKHMSFGFQVRSIRILRLSLLVKQPRQAILRRK